jgi:Tat protein secretion system quality control protein TatD with DNase activity
VPLAYIDTHAHLDDEQFQTDLPAVIERAATAGVGRIVTIATTASSSRACTDLAAAHPELRATVGIQPNHVAQAAKPVWIATGTIRHFHNRKITSRVIWNWPGAKVWRW